MFFDITFVYPHKFKQRILFKKLKLYYYKHFYEVFIYCVLYDNHETQNYSFRKQFIQNGKFPPDPSCCHLGWSCAGAGRGWVEGNTTFRFPGKVFGNYSQLVDELHVASNFKRFKTKVFYPSEKLNFLLVSCKKKFNFFQDGGRFYCFTLFYPFLWTKGLGKELKN